MTDLITIGIIQAAAFAISSYLLYKERPARHLIVMDRIYALTADELEHSEISIDQLWYYVDLPKSKRQAVEVILATELVNNTSIIAREDLYIPAKDKKNRVTIGLMNYLDNFSTRENDCYLMRLTTKHFTGSACFNPATSELTVR